MKTSAFAGLAMLTLGCSSLAPTPHGGPCKPRSGSYFVDFVQQSGNCGRVEPAIVVLGGQSSEAAASACVGGGAESADLCSVVVDTTCPSGPGHALTLRGKVAWSQDGATGQGSVSLTLMSGAVAQCDGIYELVYTRQ